MHLSSAVWKDTPPIAPVSRADQVRALKILDQSLFDEEAFRFTPELLAHLQADLQIDWHHFDRFGKEYLIDQRMAFVFGAVLKQLLEPRRLSRVQDNENRYRPGEASFTLAELFSNSRHDRLEGPPAIVDSPLQAILAYGVRRSADSACFRADGGKAGGHQEPCDSVFVRTTGTDQGRSAGGR